MLVQRKKSIVSHDRFLTKLRLFSSDAVGLLNYLLGELQAGRAVPNQRTVSALRAAICLLGNAFAALLVERRRCILQQLNNQLVPLLEEECENKRKFFGNNFGQRAKDRMDAIRSLSKSSSVFFRLGDPLHETSSDWALGVAKKVQPTNLSPTDPKEQSGGGRALRACLTPRGDQYHGFKTTADIQPANAILQSVPPPLIHTPYLLISH